MVGLGLAMVPIGLSSLWLRYRSRLYEPGLMHRATILMGPSGFIAVLAGWITTEVGPQAYTVYGLLRTADSPSRIDARGVPASLVAFVVVYFILFGAGTFYILRLMSKPPIPGEPGIETGKPIRSAGVTPAAGLGTQSAAGSAGALS